MVNRVVPFLPGCAIDKTRQFDTTTFPADRLTNPFYFFAGLQQQGQT
jgi:hypothetical protein